MIEQNELTAELETIRENTISGCLLPWIY
jgi:hypothetical protein